MRLAGEAHGVGDLGHTGVFLFQESGGLPQVLVTDEVAGGKTCGIFHPAVQLCAAHADLLGQLFHAECGVVNVFIDGFHDAFRQDLVISLHFYGHGLLFLCLFA